MKSMSRSAKKVDAFYTTRDWHKLRSRTKALWKRNGWPCGVCGEALDWTSRVTVDHIKERKEYPELAYEPTNLQCTCHPCNTRKSAARRQRNRPEIGPDGYAL